MKLSELVTVPVPPIMDMVRIRPSDGGGGGGDGGCRLMMACKNMFHGKASLGGTGGGVGGHSK